MTKMTAKQQVIYDYIVTFTDDHGYPPSVREIGAALGLKSPSTVHFHLKGLVRAGVIDKDDGKTRAITLTDEAARRRNQIPVLGHVAAGAPILAEQYIEDYLTYDVGPWTGDHFALRVRGESMLGIGICPGDLVVVRQQQAVQNGDIVVALIDNEATVKTYQRKGNTVSLLPHNPEYLPIDGTFAQIIGKVIALVRKY